MAKAVRVSMAEHWAYLPVLAPSTGRMLSDSGPLFPNSEIKKSPEMRCLYSFLEAAKKGLAISGGKLFFGKKDNAHSYNDFMDMSLILGGNGVEVSRTGPIAGDIVIAVFSNEVVMPGLVVDAGRRKIVELPDAAPKKERCFFASENGKLLAVSYQSHGMDSIRMVSHHALISWLAYSAPNIVTSDFITSWANGLLEITNTANKKKYAIHVQDEEEASHIAHLLKMHGLAGILKNYSLAIVKEPTNGKDNSSQASILE